MPGRLDPSARLARARPGGAGAASRAASRRPSGHRGQGRVRLPRGRQHRGGDDREVREIEAPAVAVDHRAPVGRSPCGSCRPGGCRAWPAARIGGGRSSGGTRQASRPRRLRTSQASSASCARTTPAASASEKRRSILSRGSPTRSVGGAERQPAVRVRQLLGMVLEAVAPGRVAEEEPRQPRLRPLGLPEEPGGEAERPAGVADEVREMRAAAVGGIGRRAAAG